MRHNLTVLIVLAGFLPALSSSAQDQPLHPSAPEEQSGEEPAGREWPRERPMLYYEGFGVMDFDRDGLIGREEYERAFRRMDTDGDGSVSPGEWKAVHGPAGLSGPEDPRRYDWENLDRDGDGRMDRLEYGGLGPSAGKVRYEALDRDADGAVSETEWEAFRRERPRAFEE